MVDQPKTREDFENMSDEDFLKLDENAFSGNVPEGETSLTTEEEPANAQPSTPPQSAEGEEGDAAAHSGDVPDTSADGGESDGDGADSSTSDEDEEGESQSDEQFLASEAQSGSAKEGASTSTKPDADAGEEGEDSTGSEGEGSNGNVKPKAKEGEGEKPKGKDTPAKAGYYKLPDGMDTNAMDAAVGFYQEVTKPFKADGRDFTVRSADDAIRLMQQGVNYSRRMQELKPMKALNRMLSEQGLTDPDKINFLIDVSKGNKDAIAKLLKENNIDPMDLDPEKDSGYQATNYQGDPRDNDFRDALDNLVTTPEGQALVTHIQKDWDKVSKGKLHENPAILGNLAEMKRSGVYDKVVEELNYQRSIGYLTDVPFLQAFDQVGLAMKNAGVFDPPKNPAPEAGSMAPLQAQKPAPATVQPQSQPVASGARKSTAADKAATNPHLSSAPPSQQTGDTTPKEPDWAKMSDEDFLKMAPPE